MRAYRLNSQPALLRVKFITKILPKFITTASATVFFNGPTSLYCAFNDLSVGHQGRTSRLTDIQPLKHHSSNLRSFPCDSKKLKIAIKTAV